MGKKNPKVPELLVKVGKVGYMLGQVGLEAPGFAGNLLRRAMRVGQLLLHINTGFGPEWTERDNDFLCMLQEEAQHFNDTPPFRQVLYHVGKSMTDIYSHARQFSKGYDGSQRSKEHLRAHIKAYHRLDRFALRALSLGLQFYDLDEIMRQIRRVIKPIIKKYDPAVCDVFLDRLKHLEDTLKKL